jgi:hypothetical protein
MNFLRAKTTWSSWQLWIFKWGVFTAGVLVGYYFKPYLPAYLDLFWLMSIVCCVVAAFFWLDKIKK